MKNYSKFLLITLTAHILSSCQVMTNDNSSKNSDESNKVIVANYQNGKVSQKNVETVIAKLVAQNPKLNGLVYKNLNSLQKEAIVKEFVLNEIIYDEAKDRNLHKDQDYQDALKIFETELLKQKLFTQLIKEAGAEENVKKQYDKLVNDAKNKKDIRLGIIVLASLKDAENLGQLLQKNPAIFSDIAKKRSQDKSSRKIGGDLGFVFEDNLSPEIVKQARTLGRGQIAKPMAVGKQWLIIKLIDERAAKIEDYNKIKDNLSQKLVNKAIEDFVIKSLDDAKITIEIK